MSFESLFSAYEEQDARTVLRDPSFFEELRTYHFNSTAKKLQHSKTLSVNLIEPQKHYKSYQKRKFD